MIETPRLVLRRPTDADVPLMFERYASDIEVTQYLGWPRHTSLDDTRAFVAFSDAQWKQRPAGPVLLFSRADGMLLGSSGLTFEASWLAQTGYVLARDAWGQGYATEALRAMVQFARGFAIARLYAICHADHAASAHVLEKCGFEREGRLRKSMIFPNLAPEPQDVLSYSIVSHRSAPIRP